MKKLLRKTSVLVTILAVALLFSGCKHNSNTNNNESDGSDPVNTDNPSGTETEPENGTETEDKDEVITVTAGECTITTSKDNKDTIAVDDTNKTITLTPAAEKAEYTISGSFDGQIINKTKNTVLVLNNAALTNKTGVSAIYGELKTEIKAEKDSVNTITVTGPEKAPDATKDPSSEPAVYCEKAIEIGGSGTLTVSCEYGHGVKASKIELKGSGTFNFDGGADSSAANCNEFIVEEGKDFIANFKDSKNGIKADETITIASGTFNFENITKVALKTDTSKDDPDKEHFIKLDGGKFTFTNCKKVYDTDKDENGDYKFSKAEAVTGNF